MGSLSDYGENAAMGHLFGNSFTSPATIYVALCTADPTDAGVGSSMSEVASLNAYGRRAITFSAAATRAASQAAVVTFPTATGSWATVSHWSLVDTLTHAQGNMLAHGAFGSSFSPVTGNTPSIAAGQVSIIFSAIGGVGFTSQCVHSLLDLMFRATGYAQPPTYVCLCQTMCTDADTILSTKELTGVAYTRQLIDKAGGTAPRWAAVSGGATENSSPCTFTAVGSGGWTQLRGMALVNTSTVSYGNILTYDSTNVTVQTPASGDTVSFAYGAIDISLS